MRLIRSVFAHALQLLIARTGQFSGKYRLARLIGRFAEGAPVKSTYGVMMEAHVGDLTNYYNIRGYDDHRVADAVATLKQGEAFIDVGANAGLFSLMAAQAVGPSGAVLAFEPQEEIAERLRRNRRLNGAEWVHVFERAVGTTTHPARITQEAAHSGGAHIDPSADEPILVVDPTDIMGLIKALVGERRTMVKVDVEGQEEDVIRALMPLFDELRVKSCIVEIDEDNLERSGGSARRVYQLMETAGFRPSFGLDESGHYDEVFERRRESSARQAQ